MRALIILSTTAVIYIAMAINEKGKAKEKEKDEFLEKLGNVIDKTGMLVYASGIGIIFSLVITRNTERIATWFALPITMWFISTVLSLIYDKEKKIEEDKTRKSTQSNSNHKVKEVFKDREWRKAMREEMYKPKGERHEIRK